MNSHQAQMVNTIQQEEITTNEIQNRLQEKNAISGNEGQETKRNPKKAIKFSHLIGIIIF